MKRRARAAIRMIREGRLVEDPSSIEVPTDEGSLWIGFGSIYRSTPDDDLGPYVAVEVRYPGAPASRPWTPVDEVIAYIEGHAE